MSTASLYRFSGIILLLSVGLNLVASIWPFLVDTSLNAPMSELQSPQWATFYSLSFIIFILLLIGLPAMYLRLSGERGGKMGLIGLFLYLVGIFLKMATIAFFVSVIPILAKQAPEVIDPIYDSNFAIFPLGGMLLCLIGFILLGSAVIRAKVYPTFVGVMIIVSALLDIAQIAFQDGTSFAIVNLLFAISIALALASVGKSLASGQKSAS
ncbi:hypothetical protein KHA93_16295 [Bacillus sp. FJAT-49732]|uniref:DUF4386 family protein n=1 Tax=Lederbergia citrisecunda TaxID=2833583 RepID=A0A942YM83_9BACI|nr:hypothetical protein [Lederbergia citrisecunda]MBS4201199.1 hypothetical protein [Lederbergia citrisecunda]